MTNVDYEIVDALVSEGEGTENIMTALRILKSWSPDWNLFDSVVACFSKRINAIEPGS